MLSISKMSSENSLVYSKKSTIPGIGKGLFAKVPIKKDYFIAEFKGQLRSPGEKTESNRSNIFFYDGFILVCGDDDLASFSNDPIMFPELKPENRRHLIASLRSEKPFYEINPYCTINARISIDTDSHRAFLFAMCDIKKDEEIFNHYGFDYWFQTEISELGFLKEDEIEQNGLPSKIFEYPAFINYVRATYANYLSLNIIDFGESHGVLVNFPNGRRLLMHLKDYSKLITKRPNYPEEPVL